MENEWRDGKYVKQGFYDDLLEVVWNPLTCDSDAFRLAVKLNLSIDVFDDLISINYLSKGIHCEPVYELPKTDPCKAARRAIVRAAALIGENYE